LHLLDTGPNSTIFFIVNEDFLYFSAVKQGHFITNLFFSNITNTQALQLYSKNQKTKKTELGKICSWM